MRVMIPTPLRSYTGGASEVEASGASLAAVLESLDHQFPGIRFRVVDEQGRLRQHMNIFVAGERCRDRPEWVLSGGRAPSHEDVDIQDREGSRLSGSARQGDCFNRRKCRRLR